MFYFTNTLLIRSLLHQFAFSVTVGHRGVTVGFGIRVENLDIKECLLLPISPKASCLNVSSCLIGGDCALCRQLFLGQWLQQWLHRDTMAHFSHQACCNVSYLIVANYGKSTSWAAQGMFNIEWFPTWTM